MNRVKTVVLLFALFFVVGCGNKSEKLIEALNNNADYWTVSELIEKGAKPTAEAIQVAHGMVERSRTNLEKIKSGETEVMGGNSEIMVKQYEDEMAHNQMIVDLLSSNM